METLTLLVLPPAADKSPPAILFMENGVWYRAEHHPPEGDLEVLRESVKQELGTRAAAPDIHLLKSFCGEKLYEKVVSRDLRKRLREMVVRAKNNPADPPLLIVHSYEEVDWIPWELMWDEVEDAFLGYCFQIARLPVGEIPLEPPAHSSSAAAVGEVRPVKKVYSVLGEGALAEAADRAKWQATFDGLVQAERQKRWPDGGQTIPDDVLSQMEAPDIIHVTCHAEVRPGDRGVAWRLREDLRIEPGHFGTMYALFHANRPLVFANACASAGLGSLGPGNFGHAKSFPRRFVEKLDATGFVGTFGPVQEGAAVEFAKCFYTFLLQDKEPIAKALWRARKAHEQEDDHSWLLYSLYGQPHTTFTVPANE